MGGVGLPVQSWLFCNVGEHSSAMRICEVGTSWYLIVVLFCMLLSFPPKEAIMVDRHIDRDKSVGFVRAPKPAFGQYNCCF
jgi:uncharacterized membrane protein YhaH (DUF805 family)